MSLLFQKRHKEANKPDAVKPALTILFQTWSQWRGVTDPHR